MMLSLVINIIDCLFIQTGLLRMLHNLLAMQNAHIAVTMFLSICSYCVSPLPQGGIRFLSLPTDIPHEHGRTFRQCEQPDILWC